MSLPGFATQTVKVWRAPLVSDHGTQVSDWNNAVSHEVTGVSVQPRGGSVDLINRYAVTTVLIVFAEITADVLDTDRIEHGGVTYLLDGPVARYETGVLDHLEIPLRRVEG